MFDFDKSLNNNHKTIFEQFQKAFESKLISLNRIPNNCKLHVSYSSEVSNDSFSPCQIRDKTIELNSSFDKYTKEEQYALIAHEIGHLTNPDNESACDAVAKDLGLSEHMRTALNEMIAKFKSLLNNPLNSLFVGTDINNTLDSLKVRIDKLK